jgi:hypothetical protein
VEIGKPAEKERIMHKKTYPNVPEPTSKTENK